MNLVRRESEEFAAQTLSEKLGIKLLHDPRTQTWSAREWNVREEEDAKTAFSKAANNQRAYQLYP